MLFYDYYYLVLVLPAVLLAMWASYNVNSTYKKYSKVASSSGMTGYDAARMVLDSNGLHNVQIERIAGNLTDHYDPKSNIIRLSDSVYGNNSAAAIGVAAHEAGHAVQHSTGYAPIKLRMAIIPVCNIGSNLAIPLILIGLIFSNYTLAVWGCAFFGLSTVFQLVTLPVEFNASSRAISALNSSGRLNAYDLSAAKKTLKAAALTYVAALAVSLMNLLRLLLIVSGSRRRD